MPYHLSNTTWETKSPIMMTPPIITNYTHPVVGLTFMTSCNLNYSFEALPPNMVTLGISDVNMDLEVEGT
jgi:hypothetical protein